MEFINGHHFHYELFKFLKTKGIAFTAFNPEHVLHPDNRHNFGIRCTEHAARGVAHRFTADDSDNFIFQSLTDTHEALDAFIATQLAKPVSERVFPYECILRVHGQIFKMVTSGIAGRRPNSIYEQYPIIKINFETPFYDRNTVASHRNRLNDLGVTIPERINFEAALNGGAYQEPIHVWSNTNTFFSASTNVETLLNTLSTRYNDWKEVIKCVCFYNSQEAALRQMEENQRRQREEEALRARREAERVRLEQEKARAAENLLRIDSRINAFKEFAPVKKKAASEAHEFLEKFCMNISDKDLQIVQGDSSDVLPSINIECVNGSELELVANNKGLFVKNILVPQELLVSFVHALTKLTK